MEGISVVNPLMEIQRKLTKIKNLLAQEADALEELSAVELKDMIEIILNE